MTDTPKVDFLFSRGPDMFTDPQALQRRSPVTS